MIVLYNLQSLLLSSTFLTSTHLSADKKRTKNRSLPIRKSGKRKGKSRSLSVPQHFSRKLVTILQLVIGEQQQRVQMKLKKVYSNCVPSMQHCKRQVQAVSFRSGLIMPSCMHASDGLWPPPLSLDCRNNATTRRVLLVANTNVRVSEKAELGVGCNSKNETERRVPYIQAGSKIV